jgi:hypothetical protein
MPPPDAAPAIAPVKTNTTPLRLPAAAAAAAAAAIHLLDFLLLDLFEPISTPTVWPLHHPSFAPLIKQEDNEPFS